MKGILEFTLPEEYQEFQEAQRGFEYRRALIALWEYTRKRIKYDSVQGDVLREVSLMQNEIIKLVPDLLYD